MGNMWPTGGDARVSALSQKPGMALRYGLKGRDRTRKRPKPTVHPCYDRTVSNVPETVDDSVARRLVRKAAPINRPKRDVSRVTDRKRN
jgi:hypothetical protein